MIILIVSLLPLFVYLYYFLFLRKKQKMNFEIDYGINCFNCKDEIDKDDVSKNRWIQYTGVTKRSRLCVSCKRDEKITKLSGGLSKITLNRIVISDRFTKFQLFFAISAFLLIAMGLFIKLEYNYFLLFGNSFNFISSLMFIGRSMAYINKKPSH